MVGVDWIPLAHERDKLKTLVKAVVNLRVVSCEVFVTVYLRIPLWDKSAASMGNLISTFRRNVLPSSSCAFRTLV